jgi:hypothetical protein
MVAEPFISRLDATVLRARRYERLRPPAIDDPAATDEYATLTPSQGVISDDLIDQAPRIRILEVGGSVTQRGLLLELHRSHPYIEGIRLWCDFDPGALTMLPGLRFIQLAGGSLTSEAQAALPEGLEELWANHPDVELLPRLKNLKLLRARLPQGRASQTRALALMSNLRVLDLECGEQLRAGKLLGRLRHVEQISINSVAGLGLSDLAECTELRGLSVGTLKTLDGVESLASLESLSLGGRVCPSLAPLLRAPRLAHLSITSRQAPRDVHVLGELVGLRSLYFYPGSISSGLHLKSAALFARLTNLEYLRCHTLLDDHDLTPLGALTKLTYLCFYGTFPAENVRWLKERLPGCNVDLTAGMPPASTTKEKIGVLMATTLDDGRLSVFEDLTDAVGLTTNHEVQDAVESELSRRAPDVLARVQFDSETEAFCVYAETRDDIRAVSTAVETLGRRRKHHGPSNDLDRR